MDLDNRAFQDAYVECALWSSLDNDAIEGRVDRKGENLDENFGPEDIADATLERMHADCDDFMTANEKDLILSGLSMDRAGHDFWLNRNGHGSGFWDEYSPATCEKWNAEQLIAIKSRDFSKRDGLKHECDCPYHACQRLSDASKVYGEVYLEVGEDNMIHGN